MEKEAINSCQIIKAGTKKGLEMPNIENGKCTGYTFEDSKSFRLACLDCEFNIDFNENEPEESDCLKCPYAAENACADCCRDWDNEEN